MNTEAIQVVNADPITEVVEKSSLAVHVQDEPELEHFTIIASKPSEMLDSQLNLIEWAKARLEKARADLAEREECLANAQKCKLRVKPWEKLVREAASSVHYYDKVLKAFQAGYFLVPEFPMQVIAVRTKRKRPGGKTLEWRRWATNDQTTIEGQLLPAGEGRFVSSTATADTWSEDIFKDGKVTGNKHYIKLTGFQAVDLPLRLVKPRILEDLDRARRAAIFDEIGILQPTPSRRKSQRRRHPDPMLFGRVIRKVGSHYVTSQFLISWWVDTATL